MSGKVVDISTPTTNFLNKEKYFEDLFDYKNFVDFSMSSS